MKKTLLISLCAALLLSACQGNGRNDAQQQQPQTKKTAQVDSLNLFTYAVMPDDSAATFCFANANGVARIFRSDAADLQRGDTVVELLLYRLHDLEDEGTLFLLRPDGNGRYVLAQTDSAEAPSDIQLTAAVERADTAFLLHMQFVFDPELPPVDHFFTLLPNREALGRHLRQAHLQLFAGTYTDDAGNAVAVSDAETVSGMLATDNTPIHFLPTDCFGPLDSLPSCHFTIGQSPTRYVMARTDGQLCVFLDSGENASTAALLEHEPLLRLTPHGENFPFLHSQLIDFSQFDAFTYEEKAAMVRQLEAVNKPTPTERWNLDHLHRLEQADE